MGRPSRLWQGGLLAACVFGACITSSADAQVPIVSKLFAPRVPADPNADYKLSEEHGPWMILAATFGGEEGKKQAQQLVLELRRDHNLPAYTYSTRYDYTGNPTKLSANGHKMRYAKPSEYDSTAVMIGDFSSADDERIKTTLEKIKYLQPAALDYSKTGKTNQRYAVIRLIAQRAKGEKDKGKEKEKGLMSNAFMTRNPLLPKEYFNAPIVDPFVRGLNANVDHSLLKCPGKFTVVVGTFEGASAFDLGKGTQAEQLEANGDRLDQAAYKAHRLTEMLRKQGVEAYEYHDRTRSLVTIGSFEKLGDQRKDGSFAYDPAIIEVMQKYSAAGATGFKPQQRGLQANGLDDIPFDFQPAPIAVPRSEKSSLYSGAWFSGK